MNTQSKKLPELDYKSLSTYDNVQNQLKVLELISYDIKANIDAHVRLIEGEDGENSKQDLESLFYQALYMMEQSMRIIDTAAYHIEKSSNDYFLRGASPYGMEKIKQSLQRY